MYTKEQYISKPVGNNAFSYNKRIALGSKGKLFVPSLIAGTIDDLKTGTDICFEEVVDGKLISCVGLKNFLQTTYHGVPVYIVENHNHALTFWRKRLNDSTIKRLNVIHIDQHADTKPNENILQLPDKPIPDKPIPEVEDFVNNETNVGNFITAAVNSGIIEKVIQVRTDTALTTLHSTLGTLHYIVDIDVDFREAKQVTEGDVEIVRELIKKADLVTIATSPYFMDQHQAIEIIKKLLSP